VTGKGDHTHMSGVLSNHLFIIVVVLLGLEVVTLLFALFAITSSSSLRKRLRRWKSIHESADLELVYERTLEAVSTMTVKIEEMKSQMLVFEQRLEKKVDTPAVQRYNAFAEIGNDLSYSVALLDEHQNGVVLTSIYGRNDSNTYGKPVYGGQSEYALTDEEKQAIYDVHHEITGKKERQAVR
jgi:hypothetical protein